MPKPNIVLSAPKYSWLRVVLFFISFIFVMSGVGRLAGNTFQMVSLFTAAGFVLVWLFRRFLDGQSFESLGWKWKGYETHGIAGLLVAVSLLGIGTILLVALGQLTWLDYQFSMADFFLSLFMMLLVGFYEELVFRGYFLGNLLHSMKPAIALPVSAAIFAVLHGANPNTSWLALINVFLAGLLLGINYIFTRNLWFGIALHVAWNFIQGPVLGYEVSGMELPSVLVQNLGDNNLLTGGSFGFEGSLLNLILILVATTALALVYYRMEKKNETLPFP
ncbi:CPBP family intramembrane glutamic endopeptidase [Flavihumibacter stibioxidans]|uniref:CAAX prenyl protease 2/Lysostaphin resistance protein A-like domain-containing protein n=1 Tax=Flavihumibacter stibioxidans TaxID=1834163 RepID=A0ABR7MC32_9BACT|nr:type II CAAX endopeptidase family protein [Flavihumibacter stibioxidans]MBC6492597.1 hypothetical protein [Flavihumibacter stibioxidans]